MGLLERKSIECPVDRDCSEWARKYMGLCLCSRRDGFSFALGSISVISWGVAEIPQIITNYKKKSADGVSILFLLTWIAGDFFNLIGCLLEPATLPTQYYMALLFTITTLALTAQAVYYVHIYPRLKCEKRHEEVTIEQNHGGDAQSVSDITRQGITQSSPIPLPSSSPDNSDDLYIMSARCLSVSRTPTLGSFTATRTPPADVENHLFREPLLAHAQPQSAPPNIKTTLCVFSLMTFFLGGYDYKLEKSHKNDMISNSPTRGMVLPVRRQLLEAIGALGQKTSTTESNGLAPFLGWGMTAIYMGGRLPQICLNIKRGTADGLNPFMFVFALLGNLTYVGSILVHSLEWSKIRPNLPWLVDAGGCVVLDIFIISQFIYFNYRRRN